MHAHGPHAHAYGLLEFQSKNHPKIDAQNDRFGPPKASQNDSKIDPKIDQKSMQKTKRKKSRTKANIEPSKTKKPYKNQSKINKHQKLISRILIDFWLPKRPK